MSVRAFTLVFAACATVFGCFGCFGCSGTSVTDIPDPNAGGATAPGAATSPSGPGSSSAQPGSPADPNAPPGPSVRPVAEKPVDIRNVSFAAAKNRGYGPYALDITFSVVNQAPRPIERLNEVSLTFGGNKKAFAIVCDGVWFGALGSTQVLTLHLEDGGGKAYLFPTCGEPSSGPTTMPWGNSVTVELDGLLDDASPWTASAMGTR